MSKSKDKLIKETHALLDKNYGFTSIGTEFYTIDFYNDNKTLSKSLFVRHAKIILSVDSEIITDWFESKENEIRKKLLDYLNKVDKTERGSIKLSNKMIEHFKHDQLITDNMVIAFFESFYITNILDVIIKEQTNKLDPKTIDSNDFADINKSLKKTELNNIYKLAKTKLNDWYYKSIVGDKLDDLLSQFVIILGKTEWKVTWIGHGPVTEEKLIKYFHSEINKYGKSMSEYMLVKYQEWYDNYVIDASEREMKNERNFELYNYIQKGRLKLNTEDIDNLDI